jgi:DNA polymerase III psi subunit
MSINQRQYQQLTEMGISLWQHKSTNFHHISSNQDNSAKNVSYLSHDVESLSALANKTFFTDLLLTLELSIGEVTAQNDHLDLGLFNWFFSADKESSIYCVDNKLVSPSIELICESPALKKQLWQAIAANLI